LGGFQRDGFVHQQDSDILANRVKVLPVLADQAAVAPAFDGLTAAVAQLAGVNAGV
jgi:hypothetical protein